MDTVDESDDDAAWHALAYEQFLRDDSPEDAIYDDIPVGAPFEHGESAMPVVSRFMGIVIAMYFNDHAPPHFHAKYGGQEASIHIETGVVEGYLPRRALALVQEWRELNQADLMFNWNALHTGGAFRAITPLE